MIMPVTPKHRIKLIVPPSTKGAKVLKSCVRCRQHKTKCDAALTKPEPCSHCAKKRINCTLDIITELPNRAGYDLVERLTSEVSDLKSTLAILISRKNLMIQALAQRSEGILSTVRNAKKRTSTPPISQIQSCLNSPVASPVSSPRSSITSVNIPSDGFVISTCKDVQPFSITVEEAYELFTNYEVNFNQFLPIFPDSFFSTIDLIQFRSENELLFWSIIITSYLNYPDVNSSANYKLLTNHIKSLVVEKCWFQTPRSVYVISSLLILTTWPLPHTTKLTNNISIKFLSLMKNLSLQFGLHKLEFLNEFSHKTKMTISNEVNLDNIIRERIYKFININSNYWLIYLGLSNNSHNGSSQDYIVNKSANIDIFDKSISPNDHYINSLLKVSMIQSKLNENMSELVGNSSNESILKLPNQINTTKVINLKMFEVILSDLNKVLNHDNKVISNLIEISIVYSKLQLYIYSLSHLTVDIKEYKTFVSKICTSCFELLSLYQAQFKELSSFNQLPIHYKFPVELASFILLKVFKSPLLNTLQDYQLVKQKFNEFYHGIILKGTSKNDDWKFMNAKFMKIWTKFDTIDNTFLIEKMMFSESESEVHDGLSQSFSLIKKMKNYLVSSMSYELVWCIYEFEKSNSRAIKSSTPTEEHINWGLFGLDEDRDQDVIKFILSNESILIL